MKLNQLQYLIKQHNEHEEQLAETLNQSSDVIPYVTALIECQKIAEATQILAQASHIPELTRTALTQNILAIQSNNRGLFSFPDIVAQSKANFFTEIGDFTTASVTLKRQKYTAQKSIQSGNLLFVQRSFWTFSVSDNVDFENLLKVKRQICDFSETLIKFQRILRENKLRENSLKISFQSQFGVFGNLSGELLQQQRYYCYFECFGELTGDCGPNCQFLVFGDAMFVFAVRDIQVGEVITVDFQQDDGVQCQCEKCVKFQERKLVDLEESQQTRFSKFVLSQERHVLEVLALFVDINKLFNGIIEVKQRLTDVRLFRLILEYSSTINNDIFKRTLVQFLRSQWKFFLDFDVLCDL